jgi:hypothetical protein
VVLEHHISKWSDQDYRSDSPGIGVQVVSINSEAWCDLRAHESEALGREAISRAVGGWTLAW